MFSKLKSKTKFQNIKLKSKSKQTINNRKYRKIRMPRKTDHIDIFNKLKTPFLKSHSDSGGDFKFKNYVHFSKLNIMLSYIWNMLYSTRFIAIVITIVVIAYKSAGLDTNVLFDPTGSGGSIFYSVTAFALFMGYVKTSDRMKINDVVLKLNSARLNSQLLDLIDDAKHDSKYNDEVVILENYTNKYNKIILFPSAKEIAAESQLFNLWKVKGTTNDKQSLSRNSDQNIAVKKDHDSILEYTSKLNLNSRRKEHFAAKKIADLKQAEFGGKNEYDLMVRKYRFRTIPEIKDIIERVQK